MKVEIYFADKEHSPEWILEFEVMPRVGEYLSIEVDGYFKYYDVVEIWHRRIEGDERFSACLRVELND